MVSEGRLTPNEIVSNSDYDSMPRKPPVPLGVDKGSEWILSVARHRDPLADPVGMLRNAEIDLD